MGLLRAADERAYRANGNDSTTPTLLDHDVPRRLRAQENALQVDILDTIPDSNSSGIDRKS